MRLLLFDIDGTMIKTQGLGKRCLEQAFEELYGWPQACEGVSFLGATDPGLIRDAFALQGRSPAEAEAEAGRLVGRYLEILSAAAEGNRVEVEVLRGVRELIDHLAVRGDCQLALLTGNVEGAARIKLELAGLWDYFPFGAYGDDAGRRVDLLPVALERAKSAVSRRFAPEDTVVIGDTARDVEVGQAHGARTVAVASGWVSASDLAETGADVVLEDLAGLEQVVASLLG